jgi:hypothetical protein
VARSSSGEAVTVAVNHARNPVLGGSRSDSQMWTRRLLAGTAALTALFVAGIWAGLSGAGDGVQGGSTLSLTAKLNVAQEVPKPRAGAAARGTFSAGLVRNASGGRLSWRLTFQGLSGSATASHVHLAKRGKAGAVAVPLCGPCRSGARGSTKVSAKTVTALLAGGAYVNVHTARNPAGEIRGQVARSSAPAPPPPPPGTATGGGTTTYEDPYP